MLKNKGITLIALVVSIIVLLILVGISIQTLAGENRHFTTGDQCKKTNSYRARQRNNRIRNISEVMEIMGNLIIVN